MDLREENVVTATPVRGTLGDSLPVGLNRTVSEISRNWLFGYDFIDKRSMSENEIESSRKVLGHKLGTTLVDRREVILDSFNDLELNEERILKAVITDSLAAHEMGAANYFGHFSVYCHPHYAFPINLLIQDEIYEATYKLPSLGPSYQGSDVGTMLLGVIRNLVNSEWLAEMLALISEKRRLQEHLHNQWDLPLLTKALTHRISHIESMDRQFSSYGVGILVWKKLRERFRERVDELLLWLRHNQIVEAEKGFSHVSTTHLPRFDGTEHVIVTYRNPKGEPAAVPPSQFVLELLDGQTTDVDYRGGRSVVSRSDALSLRTRGVDHSIGIREFPEIRAMCVGELWLALHSILQVQWISGDDGLVAVYMDRNSRRICSPEVQKLAIRLLQFRNQVLDSCAEISSEAESPLVSLWEFVHGKISLRQLTDRSTTLRGPKFQIDPRNLGEQFTYLQASLRKYYNENKSKIERQIRHPEDFFPKVV
jgi:hypothetical protein